VRQRDGNAYRERLKRRLMSFLNDFDAWYAAAMPHRTALHLTLVGSLYDSHAIQYPYPACAVIQIDEIAARGSRVDQ
jgi:hypothetical protein